MATSKCEENWLECYPFFSSAMHSASLEGLFSGTERKDVFQAFASLDRSCREDDEKSEILTKLLDRKKPLEDVDGWKGLHLVFRYVAAARLIDLIALRELQSPPAQKRWPRSEDECIVGLKANRGLAVLRNWSENVRNISALVVPDQSSAITPHSITVQATDCDSDEGPSDGKSQVSFEIHGPSAREMAKRMVGAEKESAAVNFVVAAWTLRFLLGGRTDIPKDFLTRLWDELGLQPHEKRALEPVTPQRVLQPLALCLIISPLVIFSGSCLWKDTRVNCLEILQNGYGLGNERPPRLSKVESAAWDGLFNAARTDKSAYQCFLDMLPLVNSANSTLPLAPREAKWFKVADGTRKESTWQQRSAVGQRKLPSRNSTPLFLPSSGASSPGIFFGHRASTQPPTPDHRSPFLNRSASLTPLQSGLGPFSAQHSARTTPQPLHLLPRRALSQAPTTPISRPPQYSSNPPSRGAPPAYYSGKGKRHHDDLDAPVAKRSRLEDQEDADGDLEDRMIVDSAPRSTEKGQLGEMSKRVGDEENEEEDQGRKEKAGEEGDEEENEGRKEKAGEEENEEESEGRKEKAGEEGDEEENEGRKEKAGEEGDDEGRKKKAGEESNGDKGRKKAGEKSNGSKGGKKAGEESDGRKKKAGNEEAGAKKKAQNGKKGGKKTKVGKTAMPNEESPEGVGFRDKILRHCQLTPTGPKVPPRKSIVENVVLHDVDGKEFSFPQLWVDLPHRPAFSAFYTAYREGLKEGAPLHSRGAASVFSILERDEFEKDPGAIQALLRSNKVVVVRALGDYQTPNFHDECKSAFDNKGFIEVQDQSQAVAPSKWNRYASAHEFLQESKEKIQSRKSLNALSLPPSAAILDKRAFSSDSIAWSETTPPLTPALGSANLSDYNPASLMRWTLAGLGGSRSYWHIDSDGFGTFVDVVCGEKWWCIAKPKKRSDSLNSFFKMNSQKEDGGLGWEFEGILLTPGTTLIMPPCTPHAVFTMSNALCKGGFFYSFKTMVETFSGIIHTIFLQYDVTNTDHPRSRPVICRMVHYLHQKTVVDDKGVPSTIIDEENCDDVRSLVAFACLVELLNVVDGRTYYLPQDGIWKNKAERSLATNDVNLIPAHERVDMMWCRGMMEEVMEWFGERYDVSGEGGVVDDFYFDVYIKTLAHYCKYIKEYAKGVEEVPDSIPHALVSSQISMVKKKNPRLRQGNGFYSSFEPSKESPGVRLTRCSKRSWVTRFERKEPLELILSGRREGDEIFYKYYCQVAPEDLE